MQSQREARAMNLFRLAMHEAAHAVVAEQLGIQVQRIRIDTDATEGDVGSNINSLKVLLSADYRQRAILVIAAGAAIERLQFGDEYLADGDALFLRRIRANFEESVLEVTDLVEQCLGEIVKIARRICKTIGDREGKWEFVWADLAS